MNKNIKTNTPQATAKAAKGGLGFIFSVVLLDVMGLGLLMPIQAYIVRQREEMESIMATGIFRPPVVKGFPDAWFSRPAEAAALMAEGGFHQTALINTEVLARELEANLLPAAAPAQHRAPPFAPATRPAPPPAASDFGWWRLSPATDPRFCTAEPECAAGSRRGPRRLAGGPAVRG
mgnify:CR=1 FL=1